MRTLHVLLLLLASAAATAPANAQSVTVWYQPTPFPDFNYKGVPLSDAEKSNVAIVHALEGSMLSAAPTLPLHRAYWLWMGGANNASVWATLMKFDLTGLPGRVDSAALYFAPYTTGQVSTPFAACQLTGPWSTSVTWASQPGYGQCAGWYPAPAPNQFAGFWLEGAGFDWYNQWQSYPSSNNGILLWPQNTNNTLVAFYSTLYNNYSQDAYADARRPLLSLTFTPPVQVPVFKMPLPGGAKWLLSNEVGGYECMGTPPSPDPFHSGNYYFSIDITPTNQPIVPYLPYTGNIPVIAAAGGKVVFAGFNTGNGNYVVINHSYDGSNSTGFSTRYIHLQNGLKVHTGDVVSQGQLLGYMGNTGNPTTGTHLHFGMQYATNGVVDGKSSSMVRYATMEGLLLKSYQTECAVDANGVPTKRIRYYPSNNVSYPRQN